MRTGPGKLSNVFEESQLYKENRALITKGYKMQLAVKYFKVPCTQVKAIVYLTVASALKSHLYVT